MSDIIVMKFPPFFTKKQIDSIKLVNPDIFIFDEDFVADISEFNFSDSIFYLDFGKKFNKSLKYIKLPKYLKKIKLSDDYTQSLDYVVFPDTIEIMEFGNIFDNSLFTTILPKNLKELIFNNNNFNSALPQVLPEKLEKLVLNMFFDFSLNNFVIPQNLKYLKVNGKIGNKVFLNNLPDTIEHIELSDLYFKFKCNYPKLKTLIVRKNSKKIVLNNKCNKLKYLTCSGNSINFDFLNNLPESVEKIEIARDLSVNLANLPNNLSELIINIEPTQIFNNNVFLNWGQGANNPNFNNNAMNQVPQQIQPLNQQQNKKDEYPDNFIKQTNLPIGLKTLRLYDVKLLKFFEKIPFDCSIVNLEGVPFEEVVKNVMN